MPQGTGAQEHRALAPVPGQGAPRGPVALIPGDAPGIGAGFLQADAAIGQALQGHADVPGGFHRRGHREGGVPRQQGQGIEHAGDELAGHVPGEGIVPRAQAAPQGEQCALGRAFPAAGYAAGLQDGIIGLQGALPQTAAHEEAAALPQGQGQGDQKAQGGAALPAVHAGGEGRRAAAAAHQEGFALPGGRTPPGR